MRGITALIIVLTGVLFACGDDGEDVLEDLTVDFPHTVTLGPEQGLVARTGEILDHADFIRGDLVTYTNQTIKIQTGCEVSQAHCRPLHVCRLTPQSKPVIFESHDQVCSNFANEDDPSILAKAETGVGFTIKLNTEDGYGKFWVKEVTGFGDSAKVTLVYSLFHIPE
jgi:hypothetical protein